MAATLRAPAELDVYVAPKFRQVLVETVTTGHYRIVVDMTDVTYIDSTGLGVLVGALKRVRAHEGWLRLAAMSDQVARQFAVTGLTKVFEIFPSAADALTHTEPTG
jgi:anti-sigma B factor antagonist